MSLDNTQKQKQTKQIICIPIGFTKTFANFLQGVSISGIYQWCGDEPLTKYKMALAIGEAFGLSTKHLIGDATKPAGGTQRPRDTTMDRGRIEELGIGHHTNFVQGIKDSLQKWA